MSDITRILNRVEQGDPKAAQELLPLVYDALRRLASQKMTEPRKVELVKLRYFVGLTFEEAATVLGIAVPTAKEWWAFAKAWLSIELRGFTPG